MSGKSANSPHDSASRPRCLCLARPEPPNPSGTGLGRDTQDNRRPKAEDRSLRLSPKVRQLRTPDQELRTTPALPIPNSTFLPPPPRHLIQNPELSTQNFPRIPHSKFHIPTPPPRLPTQNPELRTQNSDPRI